MKALIFDSSTLISFAMNGLLEYIKELKKIFDGKFIITEDVKREIIDKPITINRFKLEALRIKNLLEENILETNNSLNISSLEIEKKRDYFLNSANTMFLGRGKNINLIHDGEASCLALSRVLSEKGINNVIAVDERTTRMLCEKPENLKKLMEKKLHTKLQANIKNYSNFKGFKIIRSTELMYVLYKKKIINIKNGVLLDALLYALKTRGCSISDSEIREIKKM